MDFHFSSSHLPLRLCSPRLRQHWAPSLSLHPLVVGRREAISEGQGGSWEVGGWGGAQGENHPSATCHTYDSCVIRLINEIIDHLMGLIINCSFAHPSSVLLPLYTFYPPNSRNT